MGTVYEGYVEGLPGLGRAGVAATDAGGVLIGVTGPLGTGVTTLGLEGAITFRAALDAAIQAAPVIEPVEVEVSGTVLPTVDLSGALSVTA